MQGRKTFEDERELRFSLSAHVPEHNFYRQLKHRLDLEFLYKLTQPYYGRCGQHSIDPVVFFKLCLVGHLENIVSDRKIIEHCSLRLDLFEEVFTRVLALCVEAGMVSGHTQVIDSALIKANASMDSLELKVPRQELVDHLERVRAMSPADRKAMRDKASQQQRTLTASRDELQEIRARNIKWGQDQHPGASNKNSRFTSNKTHYSPVDPSARIAVKPGKARKLCYLMQLSVDASRHVITHVQADHADRKDSLCLPALLGGLTQRLQLLNLRCSTLLADTGYSSGENYAFLEQTGITAFIPPHGTYKGGPEGFAYQQEGDYWLCPEGKKVTFRNVLVEKKNNNRKRTYYTTRKDCRDCPLKERCIGHLHVKKIEVT